jgi:hypothetical protein
MPRWRRGLAWAGGDPRPRPAAGVHPADPGLAGGLLVRGGDHAEVVDPGRGRVRAGGLGTARCTCRRGCGSARSSKRALRYQHTEHPGSGGMISPVAPNAASLDVGIRDDGGMPDDELLERVRELRARGRSPKEIARALKVRPATVTPLIQRLAAAEPREKRAPLIGCWVNQGWSSSVRFTGHPEWPDTGPAETGASGLVIVVVARERGSSVRVCEFLVDTWCLGVKNALGPKPVERRKLPSFYADAFRSYPGAPVEVPLVLAQRIVFGAIGYARGLGFEPHADFAKAAGHLGEWDGVCDLEFGRDGMPMYIEGPHDDTWRIMHTLRQNVGDGNFHYLAGLRS